MFAQRKIKLLEPSLARFETAPEDNIGRTQADGHYRITFGLQSSGQVDDRLRQSERLGCSGIDGSLPFAIPPAGKLGCAETAEISVNSSTNSIKRERAV